MRRDFLVLTCLFIFIAIRAEIRMKVNEYSTSDGLPHRAIGHIIQDRKGMLWFATWNGLCSFDGITFKSYNQFDSIRIGRLDRLEEATSGEIWCQSYDNRYYRFNPILQSFTISDTIPAVFQKKKPSSYKVYETERGLSFRAPFYDKQFEHPVNENKGLESTFHATFADKQGNLWVNYNDRLYKFSFLPIRYNNFRHIDGENSPLFNNEVRALMIDHHSRLWIGCKNHYVYIYDSKNKFLGYLSPQGKIQKSPVSFGGKVYHMLEDKSGCIWIATKGNGLFRMEATMDENYFKTAHFTTQNDIQTISNNDLYFLLEDRKEHLWTATFGSGIDQIKLPAVASDEPSYIQSGFRNFWNVFPKKRKGMRVRHLTFLSNEVLAASTTDGLVLCNLKTEQTETLGNGNTMQVLKCKNGRNYVASLGQGLQELIQENGKWQLRSCTVRQGELPDVVVSLTEDLEGNIWLVSDNYLTKLNIREDASEKYDESFFGKSFTFSEALPLVTRHGDLLLGCSSGWVSINPYEIRKDSTFVPTLMLTELKSNKTGQQRNELLNSDSVLVLSEKNTDFSISFSALDYVNPKNIKYAYSLERKGESDKWIYIHHHHTVSFSNLSWGDYRLKIKSTNSEGVWVMNEKEIIIHVRKEIPWILYLGITGLISLLTGGFIFLRKRGREMTDSTIQKEKIELNPSCPEIRTQDDIFIEKIMAYMEENMDNPDLSVDAFASYMGYSRSRFYKQMKISIDKTPVDFIREMRIKRAAYLLDSRQYNVSEVAFMIGFSDSKYFSKVFKKETGLTPTEYLNREIKTDEHTSA